jgi:hypothetical protein
MKRPVSGWSELKYRNRCIEKAKNCRCDAYYHDAEGVIHEIFTEDDFRWELKIKRGGRKGRGNFLSSEGSRVSDPDPHGSALI